MNKIQAPKGVHEFVPPESGAFEFVRTTLIESAKGDGYGLI